MAALDDFQVRADADLAALLHASCSAASTGTRRSRRARARSTFSTCCCARATWCEATRTVRAHFQRRFTRIFVDEFQDTDPLQAELLLLLACDDPGETRWQHVTPVAGQAVRRRRSEAVDLSVPPRRRRCLSARVRAARRARAPAPSSCARASAACPNIQRVVNAAFEPVMDGDRETHAGALRAARAVARRITRPAVRRRAAGAGAVRPAVRRGARDRALAAGRGGRLRRLAGATRAAGR